MGQSLLLCVGRGAGNRLQNAIYNIQDENSICPHNRLLLGDWVCVDTHIDVQGGEYCNSKVWCGKEMFVVIIRTLCN